ncbi:N-acetylmuramoyl-L-alanine amidase [Actinopolyspora alba]|uniref:N-acetylmuramoyl-L-alanine amidase n=2 Tax=Actinopolyspora alba TaxID=673379 RepID=A0A1I1VTF2_9ACTN|nr:N-acetylmuramoyl-L-alanine amidase [Actinopolyspora alba]
MLRGLIVGTIALATTTLLTTGAAGSTTERSSPTRGETTAVHRSLSDAPGTRSSPGVRTVRTRKRFSMVAVTWDGRAPDRTAAQYRQDGRWSSWHELSPLGSSGHGGTDVSGAAGASGAWWTGPSSRIRIRAVRAGEYVTGELELIAITPGTEPVRSEIERRSARPPVVTRAEWGADESLMRWPPEYSATTRAAIVHHTVETNDYTCARSAEVVRGLYHYHAVELGWGDIGYHALVDKCGTIFAGRTDGLRRHVVGGHTKGFNGQTFGVALIGNFETAYPTESALRSTGRIAGWKLGTVGRDPLGQTTLVSGGGKGNKYPEGTSVTLPRIFTHRDVGETACPGDNVYARMDTIRQESVAAAT